MEGNRETKTLYDLTPPVDIAQIFEDAVAGKRPAQPDEVLPGLVAGTVGAVVAPGAAGKSYFALAASLAVADGMELRHSYFGESECPPYLVTGVTGKVLYLNLEDPLAILNNRLFDFGAAVAGTGRPYSYHEKVTILPLSGRPIHLIDQNGETVRRHADLLAKTCEGYRLVIIDTLRRIHHGDENNSGQMAALMAIFERIGRDTGTTIIFAHHASKAATFNKVGDAAGAARGSSVLVDNSRWQLNLSTIPSPVSNNSWAGSGFCDEDLSGIHGHLSQAKDNDELCLYRGFFVRANGAKPNYQAPGTAEAWYWRGQGGVLYRITTPAEFAERYKAAKNGGKWLKPAPKAEPPQKGGKTDDNRIVDDIF